MPEVDVKALSIPQLVVYARSLGINPHGMDKQAIEDEIATMNNPVVPVQDDSRVTTIESIIASMSPVLEQLQADVKQLQIATGLREPEPEKENKNE